MKYLIVPVFVFLLAGAVFGDTLELYSGEIITGAVARNDTISVKITPADKKSESRIIYNFRIKRTIPGNIHTDYLAKKDKCATAEDFFKLAEYCKKNKLSDEAVKMWQETINLNPNHEKARQALGHKNNGDKWLTLEEVKQAEGLVEFKGKWIKETDLEKARAEDLKKQYQCAYPLKLRVSIQPDADAAWFEQYSVRLKEYARHLWTKTEGLTYLAEVELADLNFGGDITVVNLDQQYMGETKNEGLRGCDGVSVVAGQCSSHTFSRHVVLSKFAFSNHDNCMLVKGFGPDSFCDMCLARIIAKAPDVKWRADWPAEPPEIKITIINNGKK